MTQPGPILVTGASGQVGSAIGRLLGDRAVLLDRESLDLARPKQLRATLDRYSPSALINAAAYTQVDRAEQEEDLAHLINAESPGLMAHWCAQRKIPLIHYSTDYVFSGGGSQAWSESDPTGPVNAYGRTKLEGEKRIAAAGGHWMIFRSSWIYDANGKNFLNTMLKLGKERETLRVVSDQHGAPTYAADLALASIRALEHAQNAASFPTGTFHLCNAGGTSWHGFAQTIFEIARKQGQQFTIKVIEPIPTSAYPTPAGRPLNSRLDTKKFKDTFNITLPDWKTSLERCMKDRRALQ